jgi:hypothetical protein
MFADGVPYLDFQPTKLPITHADVRQWWCKIFKTYYPRLLDLHIEIVSAA